MIILFFYDRSSNSIEKFHRRPAQFGRRLGSNRDNHTTNEVLTYDMVDPPMYRIIGLHYRRAAVLAYEITAQQLRCV